MLPKELDALIFVKVLSGAESDFLMPAKKNSCFVIVSEIYMQDKTNLFYRSVTAQTRN